MLLLDPSGWASKRMAGICNKPMPIPATMGGHADADRPCSNTTEKGTSSGWK
jgi:hypothetical protein